MEKDIKGTSELHVSYGDAKRAMEKFGGTCVLDGFNSTENRGYYACWHCKGVSIGFQRAGVFEDEKEWLYMVCDLPDAEQRMGEVERIIVEEAKRDRASRRL